MPAVSIITICRNEAGSIAETFHSVLSQSFSDVEYIVIDGASTDGTSRIVESYANRLAYWVSEPDRGIYNAMNKGIRKAKGDYLAFLNGGDRFYTNDTLLKVFAVPHNADILYGDIFKETSGIIRFCEMASFKPNAGYLFSHTIYHQASFVRRDLFERIGLYDESYRISGDLEFFKRAIIKNHATTEYLPMVIAIFNTNGISSDPRHKATKKREDSRARFTSYGFLGYMLYMIPTFFFDLFVYRPRRKLRTLMSKP